MDLELIKAEDKEIINRVEKFFEPLHRGHSRFQIENFILNDDDFPLPDDKYWQAMLETYGRYENLIGDHFEYRKLRNEIKVKEIELEELNKSYQFSGDLGEKKRSVLIDMKQDEIDFRKLQMRSIERRVKDACREMSTFIACMDKLAPQRKYNTYEEKEKEHWLLRYAIQRRNGERTCHISKRMLQVDENKKLIEQVK